MIEYIKSFDDFSKGTVHEVISKINSEEIIFGDVVLKQNASFVANCHNYNLDGSDAILCEISSESNELINPEDFFDIAIEASKKFNKNCDEIGYHDDISVIFLDSANKHTYLKLVRNGGLTKYRFKSKMTLSGWFDINNEKALFMVKYNILRGF